LRTQSTGGGGGSNELTMDDKEGEECVNFRAEKDYQKLVKNDEYCVINNDVTRIVGNDSMSLVKGDQEEVVNGNERSSVMKNRKAIVGGNQSLAVGKNQIAQIGGDSMLAVGGNLLSQVAKDVSSAVGGSQLTHIVKDNMIAVGGNQSVTVGQSRSTTVPKDSVLAMEWSVTIANGLGAEIAGFLGDVMDGSVFQSLGPLAPLANTVLGKMTEKLEKLIKSTPIGGMPLVTAMRGPNAMLQALLPADFKPVASMLRGPLSSLFKSMPMFKMNKRPTMIHMVDKKITLSTGGAGIQLDDGKITLFAKDGIFLEAGQTINAQAGVLVNIQAGKDPKPPAEGTSDASGSEKEPPPPPMGNVIIRGMQSATMCSPERASIVADMVFAVGSSEVSIVAENGTLTCKGGPDVHLNPPKSNVDHAYQIAREIPPVQIIPDENASPKGTLPAAEDIPKPAGFPYEVVRQSNGNIRMGRIIIEPDKLNQDPDFQAKTVKLLYTIYEEGGTSGKSGTPGSTTQRRAVYIR